MLGQVRFLRMIPLQLAFLFAASYPLPKLCPLVSASFPCIPFILAGQALGIVCLPSAINWFRESNDRMSFAACARG